MTNAISSLPFISGRNARAERDFWRLQPSDTNAQSERGEELARLALAAMAQEKAPWLLGWIILGMIAKGTPENNQVIAGFMGEIAKFAMAGLHAADLERKDISQ